MYILQNDVYYTVPYHTTLYNTVQHCTTLYNTVQHCTTLYNIVQHCTTLYNTVQRCIFVYLWISTIWQRETRGWVMPTHLNFKKREKDEKTFTFSCNVRKFLGMQPPMKEPALSLSRLLLRKKLLLKRRESFPDLCQCSSLNDTIYLWIYT